MSIEWTPFTRAGGRWHQGTFRTIRNGQTLGLPTGFKGETYNKLKAEKEKIICIKFEKNGSFESNSGITTSAKGTKEFFGKEVNLIAYLAEDAIYLAPYSKGQEYLEKILKAEGII